MSVTLDQWTDDEINSMIEVGGNSYANAIYEAFLPLDYDKPHPDSTQEDSTLYDLLHNYMSNSV
jgi:stromal membrane-associated protein